jgi:hypothetical protein
VEDRVNREVSNERTFQFGCAVNAIAIRPASPTASDHFLAVLRREKRKPDGEGIVSTFRLDLRLMKFEYQNVAVYIGA